MAGGLGGWEREKDISRSLVLMPCLTFLSSLDNASMPKFIYLCLKKLSTGVLIYLSSAIKQVFYLKYILKF